jgi:hypothetical protein
VSKTWRGERLWDIDNINYETFQTELTAATERLSDAAAEVKQLQAKLAHQGDKAVYKAAWKDCTFSWKEAISTTRCPMLQASSMVGDAFFFGSWRQAEKDGNIPQASRCTERIMGYALAPATWQL